MKKFNGFTLAEVLITLGIIGVVAAMTMPTLINQTNGAQYRAAYKKALSAISQGVTLNVALDDISFADTVAGAAGATEPTAGTTGTTMTKLLSDRMNVVKVATETPYTPAPAYPTGSGVTTLPTVDTWAFFNDSSMFAFQNGADGVGCKEGTKICEGYIDVNGVKGPNKPVTCDTVGDTIKDGSSSGKITQDTTKTCTVTSPTDIYPVFYYDQTILPATNAGRTVLYGK